MVDVGAVVDAVVGAASGGRAAFELTIGDLPPGALRVVSFRGTERLSKAYSFEILVLAGEDLDLLERGLLGAGATLRLDVGGAPAGAPRIVAGVIAAIEPDTATVHERARAFRIRLVSKLWLLKKRTTSRIFQETTVPDIVATVLDKAGVAHRFDLARTYKKRDYCVQYQESDHGFIKRILAEEGIFHFYAPSDADGSPETLVFIDSPAGYPALPGAPKLVVRSGAAGRVSDDDVEALRVRASLETGTLVLRDYDFARPQLDLLQVASADAAGAITTAAAFDPELAVGAAATGPTAGAASPGAPALLVYEHRGEYGEPDVDADRAEVVLEAYRGDATTGEGVSACRRLSPGYRFALAAEAFPGIAGDYVAIEVEHEGHAPELTSASAHGAQHQVYKNRFRVVPASVARRPKRPKRRLFQVLESARVVGPPGEDIHTDLHGRIKVQFPWDLDGKDDGRSSCWIRTMQAWGGASWGTQFIPRVGMEVMVGFLSGDPDCPVVLGSVYNATHPPSFPLPASKTRSGIRTKSSPGGAGSNELAFEDAAQAEQIFLRAQRDFDEVVERNHTAWVKGDEQIKVGGLQSIAVAGSRADTVLGGVVRVVALDEASRVDGHRTDIVAGNADLRVTGDYAIRAGRERKEISGRTDLVWGDDTTVRSKGCYTTIVGRNDAKRSYVLRVEGTGQISTSGVMEIDAEKGLTLKCGKSFIKISKDKIELVAPAVTATGKDGGISIAEEIIRIQGKGQALFKFDEMIFKTPDSSMSLKKDVQIDGQKILLNSPDQVTDPPVDTSPPPTGIQMKDKSGAPLAYQRFLIKLADGSEYSGILDEDGKTELTLDGSGTITFPDMAKP